MYLLPFTVVMRHFYQDIKSKLVVVTIAKNFQSFKITKQVSMLMYAYKGYLIEIFFKGNSVQKSFKDTFFLESKSIQFLIDDPAFIPLGLFAKQYFV